MWLVGSHPSGSLHPWGLSPLSWICAGQFIATEWSSNSFFHTLCKLGIKLSLPLPKHIPFFINRTLELTYGRCLTLSTWIFAITPSLFKIFISVYGLYRITSYIIPFSYMYIINLVILIRSYLLPLLLIPFLFPNRPPSVSMSFFKNLFILLT